MRNLGNLMDQGTLFSLEGVLFCLNRLCGSGFEVAIKKKKKKRERERSYLYIIRLTGK